MNRVSRGSCIICNHTWIIMGGRVQRLSHICWSSHFCLLWVAARRW